MLKTVAKIFGVVLIMIGILGFVPAFTPNNHLFGVFHVDTLHNFIHLGSGITALLAGFISVRAARLYFQIFGVIYALVALLGLVYMDNDILGILANNMADVLLHIVIAGSALALGFSSFGQKTNIATP